MPRLRAERDAFARYRGLIFQCMWTLEIGVGELADRMGVSRQTMAKYISNPGRMGYDFMRRLHRVLNIPAEDARAALPMW